MENVLLDKKVALRIAVAVLGGEKSLKDYGGTALKETKLILKNILETLEVEEELMSKPPSKPPSKPKKPNKKRTQAEKKVSEAEMAYFGQILDGMDESDKEGVTILDLEKGKG